MSDFSLTTLFVVPVGQTAVPSSGSTQDLTAGQVGFFTNTYAPINPATTDLDVPPFFYVAQGRDNTYLQGSKRSGKIALRKLATGSSASSNVTELYSIKGAGTALNQITEVGGWNVQCGEVVTLTLRGFSSYIETLYFNGFTRSVTVNAPCCDCGADPCVDVDVPALIDQFIAKLQQGASGTNPDNISFGSFYTFARSGSDANAKLVITGKALTKYGQPCDVAANPFEFDKMRFDTFVYSGPATTADFIVADNCDIVAVATKTQDSTYKRGTSEEIQQLEKNYYSYQAGYLKSLVRMNGFNQNFESYVTAGTVYDTIVIKFNEYDKSAYQYGDYIMQDQTVIIAIPQSSFSNDLIEAIVDGFSGVEYGNPPTTTTTTTAAP
tara:strand:- start:13791 stop:14933 length:1143 start_codon:yes stop_codon:yes gene_type:complete